MDAVRRIARWGEPSREPVLRDFFLMQCSGTRRKLYESPSNGPILRNLGRVRKRNKISLCSLECSWNGASSTKTVNRADHKLWNSGDGWRHVFIPVERSRPVDTRRCTRCDTTA